MDKATTERFFEAVRFSVEDCADRKNYRKKDSNPLLAFVVALGINNEHGIAEIIYKAAEYMTAPNTTRRILLEKIAGWCLVLWSQIPVDMSSET